MWLLLDDNERKKCLLEGLVEASKRAFWDEDGRAVCPELTITSLLKKRGNAFLKFLQLFKDTQKSADTIPFAVPSEWWDHALDDVDKPLSSKDKFMHTLLTSSRNDFICHFILQAIKAISRDIVDESEGTKPIVDAMESCRGSGLADGWPHIIENLRDKPIIRCENCEKSAEELGTGVRFMVCAICKTKMNLNIHYCSKQAPFRSICRPVTHVFARNCQKEDWKRHKAHCGKEGSKRIPGTAGDCAWRIPSSLLPDYLRDSLNTGDHFEVTNLGPGKPRFRRSSALQRQVSMLETDKDADYILFSSSGEPVRFVVDDPWMKLTFRSMRATAMSDARQMGVGPMAEYLIKVMNGYPGLSREIMLRQFVDEYGPDARAEVVQSERKSAERLGGGATFLEAMSRNMSVMGQVLGR
ncbi:hypothetical protein BV22DRAFT_1020841 [Leucogyrophana mollusca]|uniref:Uncharacterized protein n=1 Tax=Leucogyrophana mollusca TaxID=85980 RepID=A0ACB8B5G6_9AGAM|nr:hypothetical protein BV22DRAFT_1020841 [Leucogyrophana mollusca]